MVAVIYVYDGCHKANISRATVHNTDGRVHQAEFGHNIGILSLHVSSRGNGKGLCENSTTTSQQIGPGRNGKVREDAQSQKKAKIEEDRKTLIQTVSNVE